MVSLKLKIVLLVANSFLLVFTFGEIKDKSFEHNNLFNVKAGASSVEWIVPVNKFSHPIQLDLFDTKNQTLRNSTKYNIKFTPSEIILKIKNITISDFGNYTVVVKDKFQEESFRLFLKVIDKPAVRLKMKVLNMVNEFTKIECFATAYPKPTFQWFFKPYLNESCDFIAVTQIKENCTHRQDIEFVSYLLLNGTHSGQIKCNASNSIGSGEDTQNFLLTDVRNGFDILDFDNTMEVAIGETIKATCAASTRYFTHLEWYHNSEKITNSSKQILEQSYTEYSNRLALILENITASDDGSVYNCKAFSRNNILSSNKEKRIKLVVTEPKKPVIKWPRIDAVNPLLIDFQKDANFWCYVFGVPKPKITWYKDGVPVVASDRIHLLDDNQSLYFNSTLFEDEGTYRCEAVNKYGQVARKVVLHIQRPLLGSKTIAILATLVILVIICFGVFVFLKIRKERKFKAELRKAGLIDFEKGALNNLNPALGIATQAEFLPYDKKWEFPREKLVLKKQLGSGAFGVVMEAEAKGIVDNEDFTKVAVKMIKKNADYTHIKALVCELKIMIHLGQHLNVLNLLGACTKNVTKRELLIIVEYCPFGNLQHYLLCNRHVFINQVDPKTDCIDYKIGLEIFEKNKNLDNSNSQNSNYDGDYQETTKPICTKDLLAWAFQVSRGMEYLVSRRVLHGDLAARNILLSDNNIVKISDFGLARRMCRSDDYKKKDDSPLPVKWMAIESITDKIFSTHSDVWSFGIVLWEFFSLAKSPYPGVDTSDLYNKLMNGYRMESPDYATKEIYKMMLDCWQAKPVMRPSFSRLTEKIGSMLEDTVKNHYINLNDPYLKMNTERLEEQSDYLSMFRPANFEKLLSHTYINNIKPVKEDSTSGYLSMKAINNSHDKDENNYQNMDKEEEVGWLCRSPFGRTSEREVKVEVEVEEEEEEEEESEEEEEEFGTILLCRSPYG